MTYRLLCSDLDGTLLSTKSDVSERTITEIKRIRNHMRIILVSARMPTAMYYIQNDLGIEDQPLICYNGALVLENGRAVVSATLSGAIVQEVFDLCRPLETDLGLYHNAEWHVPKLSERVNKEIHYTKTLPNIKDTAQTLQDWKKRNIAPHKIMLMGNIRHTDRLQAKLEGLFSEELHIYRSNDTLIELAPKEVSKLKGISTLLKPGESLQEVMAFGDNYNDLDMLVHCGLGVAVANAREEVRQLADHVTLSNVEDGVAKYLAENVHI
jgi:Cof subfamily protein (haloacid dehalogenase superfamily)